MKRGWLAVVGAGHKVAAQITPEAIGRIREADKVFYSVNAVTAAWLCKIHPSPQSLDGSYAAGKDRLDTYEEMIERILSALRNDLKVCAVFYGHPGVLAYPTHEAVRRAKKEGFAAKMLPGVSAEDCLWADLEIDPSYGCRSFEATDFLSYKRRPDTSSALILWQIGLIGFGTYDNERDLWNPEGLQVLTEVLEASYPPAHRIVVYCAASFPSCKPTIQRIPLSRLPRAHITIGSMLYVPPLQRSVPPGLRQRLPAAANGKARSGTLNVVGLGYRGCAQVTGEALNCIQQSEKLFFLVYDSLVERWLSRLNSRAVSLRQQVSEGKSWSEAVDEVVSAVSAGQNVCVAFSGHPAICLTPSHMAVKRVRERGFTARWIPAISALDCLCADLGIDPENDGCQMFEAKELLDRETGLDPRIPLVILQPGVIYRRVFSKQDPECREILGRFTRLLQKYYPAGHKIVLYEAAVFPNCLPVIRRLAFSSLPKSNLTFSSTLYVPAAGPPPLNYRMVSRLGLSGDEL